MAVSTSFCTEPPRKWVSPLRDVVHGPRPRSDRPHQEIGPIAHEAIDAEVDQSAHLVGIVDRPHVDLNAMMMRSFDEAWRHDRQPTMVGMAWRDLQRIEVEAHHAM